MRNIGCALSQVGQGMLRIAGNRNTPKKQKKEMAEHPTAKAFSSLCKRASAIMRDPAQKAEWTAKHLAAKRESSKHQRMPDANGKPAVPERLWDYIRHELSKQK